ncbi:uncharacterized protein RJT20DRAFT_419 [Scheffersomyces xylosifermentans]|uniref:uncharacterized protein n=1 Tax=Scheffersomyces xylosifermentans TaxID=1304137 RepID=UPI00315DB102
MSVRAFLQNLKKHIDSASLKSPYRFVTGNQSADMDSVISAISYSYFVNVKDSANYVIPLINIPKEDLRLRRDIESLLKAHSITEDLLYFVEDFKRLNADAETVELILVDHCNIQGDILTQFLHAKKLKVVGIIDHHADEKVFLDANPRIIHTNGSCSCLVFNYWYEQLGKDDDLFKKHSEIIELLLGPLVIDTSNLTQKVEEGDVIAFKKYQQLLDLQGAKSPTIKQILGPNTGITSSSSELDVIAQFYMALKSAKKDLSGFKFADVLRKDFKQFEFTSGDAVGFSSIGKALKWVLSNYTTEEITATLSKALVDFDIDLLVITSSYTQKENDKYTREFAYYYEVKGNDKFDNLHDLAQAPLELDAEIYGADKVNSKLEEVNSSSKGIFKIYNQHKITASRKQVVPIVKEILEKRN